MMPWIKVDDMFPHDEVFLKAGAWAPAVFGLHIAARCHAQRHRTNGLIEREYLTILLPGCPKLPRALLTKMVELGLWDAVEGVGWQIRRVPLKQRVT
jgi:hypothetical protein